MAIKYLGVKRVQGTEAERTATSIPSGTNMGWKFLGRSTRVSGDKLQVASLGNYPYYMILADVKCTSSNTLVPRFTINDDTGSNYASRSSYNGGSDDLHTSESNSHGLIQTLETSGEKGFIVNYLANKSGQEKLNICNTTDTDAGTGGNAANRREKVWKWVSNAVVTSIELINIGTGDFGTNDEIVVLGYDPTATNTSDYWEELASVELTSAGSELSSGTFTAKKYLWVQVYVKGDSSSAPNLRVQVNGDSGSNYAERQSTNGASDGTAGSQDHFPTSAGGIITFANWFVINNASDEKLFIIHSNAIDGAGGSVVPDRRAIAGKWTNTSNQITSIKIYKTAGGNYQSGSVIKVWGSD